MEIYRYRSNRTYRKAASKSGPTAHRIDEFPAGYSSAGCSPASPASASPAIEIMNRQQAHSQSRLEVIAKTLSRFLHEATNIISSSFLREAIGEIIMQKWEYLIVKTV